MSRLEEYELTTDAQIGTSTNLSAVSDLDPDSEVEVLGIVSTTNVGDVEVPIQFVNDWWEDSILPGWMKPREPTPKMAYNRVRDRLTGQPDEIRADVEGREREIRVETTKVNNEKFQIDAKIRLAGDEIPEDEDGRWKSVEDGLGVVVYDGGDVITRQTIDADHDLFPVWETYQMAALEEFDFYGSVYLGDQFQRMISRMARYWTQSVKMRSSGAVYFYPARYADHLEQIGELFGEIDEQFKSSGYAMEMNTWTLISDDQRRQQVERRAREELDEWVEGAIEQIRSKVEDSADAEHDELVDELTTVFERQLDGVDDFVAEYNTLVEAELSIEEVIEDWKGDITLPEVQEVVEETLEGESIAPAETVDAEP